MIILLERHRIYKACATKFKSNLLKVCVLSKLMNKVRDHWVQAVDMAFPLRWSQLLSQTMNPAKG